MDNTPPQVSLNAKDMQVFVVPAPLSFGFTVSEESTVTISLQDSENRILFSNNSPATFGIGNTIVTWTAIDSNGNTTTKQQIVTIVDTTTPILTIPADISVETTTALTKVTIGYATATDIFPVTVTNDAPEFFPLGVTFVNWQAVDANGNKTEAKQKVSVSRGTFTAVKDTTISKQLPNKNMGATRTLKVDSSPATRILVAFEFLVFLLHFGYFCSRFHFPRRQLRSEPAQGQIAHCKGDNNHKDDKCFR